MTKKITPPPGWEGDPVDEMFRRAGEYVLHVESMGSYWWACVSWCDPKCAKLRPPISLEPRKGSQRYKHRNRLCRCWQLNAADADLFWPGKSAGGLAATRWCDWVVSAGIADFLRKETP